MLIIISTGGPSYYIELKAMSVVAHLLDLGQLFCSVLCVFERDTNFTPFVMRFLIEGLT